MKQNISNLDFRNDCENITIIAVINSYIFFNIIRKIYIFMNELFFLKNVTIESNG